MDRQEAMCRKTPAAALVAAVLVVVTVQGTTARAGNCALGCQNPLRADADSAIPTDGTNPAGARTFGPILDFRAGRENLFRQLPGRGQSAEVTASLGFRGATTIDSRVGAIYSRLSLSFEHEFRANDPHVVSGWSGRRRTGFYGDRSEVDMMTADAVFAMRMSRSSFSFLEYRAEMVPGGSPDHQVTLRLRFDF